jgi:hypothetical protein
MNGAAPLLRLVDAAARQRCSRIPHLKAHIHSRQYHLRAPSPKPTRCPKALSSPSSARTRQSSTLTSADLEILGDFQEAQEEKEPRRTWSQEASRNAKAGPTTENVAFTHVRHDDIPTISANSIIEEGHPDRVLHFLVSTVEGQHFTRTADNATFERAFSSLDPDHFVGQYVPIYRHIPAPLHIAPTNRAVRSLEDRCNVFQSCLLDIIRRRRAARPRDITLRVYRHMLRSAAVMGDEQLAKSILDVHMQEDQIIPDLECYNSVMTACARSHEFDSQIRSHHRRTPYHRRRMTHEKPLDRFNVLRRDRVQRSHNNALRDYVLRIFKEMSGRGLPGSEETFTALMRVLGAAGDVHGVESILRSVWNIRVDDLMQHDEEELESPTFYEEDSSLRPTQRLLETVVHVFAINNKITTASLLCDYISRLYNLPISQQVWEQQFERTYQFCFKPVAWHVRKGSVLGNLPKEALNRVYDLMIDEPHNVQPNVAMLVSLAQNAIRWADPNLNNKLSPLREAVELLNQEKTKLSELYDALLTRINRFEEQTPLSVDLFAKRQEFLELSLQAEGDLELIQIAVRKCLQGSVRSNRATVREYQVRVVPNMINEFATYLPNHIHYETGSGTIRLENGYLHRQHAVGLADDHFMVKAGLLRQALDLDDHQILASRIRELPDKLRELQSHCHMCDSSGHTGQECLGVDELLAGRIRAKPHQGLSSDALGPLGADENTTGSSLRGSDSATRRGAASSALANSSSSMFVEAGVQIEEPAAVLEHIIAEPELKHLRKLKLRWEDAMVSGSYAGQTPNPTARLPSDGASAGIHSLFPDPSR